eukprot:TRINITY_DN67623_c2_g1_i1.p1 TRINITY_DN67623_c2_g1~~TRINITY_DN67623_c2_g1_i1.p1  ORF type:complete len:237 (-),score=31.01 TRINITY_DN67623_c2_g1_i1:386-1096(-)
MHNADCYVEMGKEFQDCDREREDAEVGVHAKYDEEEGTLVEENEASVQLRALLTRLSLGGGDAMELEEGKLMKPLQLTEEEILVMPRYHIEATLLRRCISTDGAHTLEDFRELLRSNIGKPPVAPSWYKPSGRSMGARRIGLNRCSNQPQCARAETEESGRFKICANCSTPRYCSAECQKQDWKRRHKLVCKTVSERRDQMQKVSAMLMNFQQYHDARKGAIKDAKQAARRKSGRR